MSEPTAPSAPFLKRFVRSGVLLGVSAASFVGVSALVFGGPPSLSLMVMALLVCGASYAIDRAIDDRRAGVASAAQSARQLTAIGLVLLVGVGVALVAGRVSAAAFALVFPASVLCYTARINGRRRIKDIAYVKALYVAFFWGLLPVLTALFVATAPDGVTVVAMALFVALKLFCGAVASDLKDMEQDRAAGLVTLPVQFGAQGTLRLLQAANVLAFASTVTFVLLGIVPAWLLIAELHAVFVAVTIHRMSRAPASRYWVFSEVLLDGAYAMLVPLVLVGRSLVP